MKFSGSLFRPFCFSLFLAVLVCAQQPARIEGLREAEEARKKVEDKIKEDEALVRKRAEMLANNAGKNANAEPTSVPLVKTETELPQQEKKLLAPDAQERQKFQELLRQPDTGICKLLAIDETRLAITDVKSQSNVPHLIGLGAFFSFTKQTHNADEWAQIRLKSGVLYPAYTEMKRTTLASSGGMTQSFSFTSGYSLAVFTTLENVSLEQVSLQHPAIQPLIELKPATQYQDFANQVKQFNAGINIGAHRYQSAIAARPDTTFVMRSVNYKKADVIIAFRIVQQDRNGNLHILWKQLKSFPSAELKGKPPKP